MESSSRADAAYLTTRLVASLNASDQEAFVGCFEPDGTVCANPSGPIYRGHHELRQVFQSVIGGFAELDVQTDIEVGRGAVSAVVWTGSGRMMDGRKVDAEGVAVITRSAAGRIVSLWNHSRSGSPEA